MSEQLAKPSEFYEIRFVGNGRPLVLEKSAIDSARERIKTRYGVKDEQNLN
jgi:hypothetical protein